MRLCVAAITLVGLLAAGSAHGQVNTETLRRDIRTRPVFLSFDGTFTGRAGNVTGAVAGAGLFGGLSVGDHLAFVRGQADYAEFNSVVKVAKLFAHARYNYHLVGPLAAEAFVQVQRDRFLRLELRNLYGAGLRAGLIESRNFELFIGVAYMLEYEIEGSTASDSAAPSVFAHRASTYIAPSVVLGRGMRLSSVAYAQPRIDALADFRLFDETIFTAEITSHLRVRIGVSLRYDTEPPVRVKTWDVEVRNSLAFVL